METGTGKVLYEKNAREKKPPASTTKIMTALLAIECGNPAAPVTISKKAASTGEATLGLAENDVLTLNALVHGALIKSGNDACVAIAEAVAPTEEEFVGLMNLKAKLLGAGSTTFFNTNGLPHREHLTTAYDLAVIARYALGNNQFREIVRMKSYELRWLKPARRVTINNTNKLLWLYPQATGIKTGTTVKAGKCLVASAVHLNTELIAVILHSGDRYGDARKLFEYGFQRKGDTENVYQQYQTTATG